ncbi:MAG TPA: bis(5'-nucleosyl)-tetraphosphatase (symmetrical) YqeK [Candidatus Hydrogenedentes bacterium]|nr:bis(5'-nucleosyl)-tetraphosphatase (symmetrical) YqeK [Candidatus Hydrogenedentota bacterium]
MPLPDVPQTRVYLDILNDKLPEKKVLHCISTTEHLLSFAPRLALDLDKALAAGLLHDICREFKDGKLLRKAEEFGLPISAVEQAKPNLLHGPLAAEVCRKKFALDDDEIYEAIFWHTTGKPDFCRLGQALYVADFSEPTRDYPEAEHARHLLVKKDFNAALLYVARVKIDFFRNKKVCAPMAEEFLRWVEKELT